MDMTVTSPSGVGVHLYEYDKIYQVTEVDYPDELDYLATDTTFNYDDAGNRTSVIDGGGTTPYVANALNQYTSANGTYYQYDTSGNMTYDGHYVFDYDPENRLTKVKQSGGPALDVADGVDSLLTFTQGGGGWSWTAGGQYGGDSAKNYYVSNEEDAWMQTQVEGAGTFKFWWKVSSESSSDYLEFYIDNQLQSGSISGAGGDWAEKTYYTLGTGAHTLKWRYVKNDSESSGEDCGWVDHVQWSEPINETPTDAWSTLTYTYDASGRRIEKKYDDTLVLKYIYDGDNCIAEYDDSNNLRRKYIHGQRIDEPICMIEGSTTNYYHFDALGSVIALTDESGNVAQVYEYSIFGQVAASDPSHTNRFLFTGREFDKETGLYYYRARYYKPEIGRFLQVDSVGYKEGMNLYRYCSNNPWNSRDPDGKKVVEEKVTVTWTYDEDVVVPRTGQILHIHKARSAWLKLSGTSSDGKHFDGNPPVTVDSGMDNLWFYHEDPCVPKDASYFPGPPGYRPPDSCDVECYRVTGTFTWSIAITIVPDIPIPGVGIELPGVSIERHMKTTIYAWICADGQHGHKITCDSNNGWKWSTNDGVETQNWPPPPEVVPSVGGDGEPGSG